MSKENIKPNDVIFKGNPSEVIWQSEVSVLTQKSKIYSRKDCDIIFLRKGVYLGSFNDREEYYLINDKRQSLFQLLFKETKISEDCQIYYINRVVQLENKWGTPNKIDVYDRDFDLHTFVGANGTYKFSVNNSMKLFSKVQGAHEKLTQEMIKEFFKSELNVEIRNAIATVFVKNKYGINDIAVITTKEKKIALEIKEMLLPLFSEYGVEINKFFFERFFYDEEFIALMTSAKKENIIKKIKFDMEKEQRKEMRKENKHDTPKFSFCNECGHKNPVGAKFCSNCGSKM